MGAGSIRNLRFETIKTIANARFVDFFVLLPTGMDATRNMEQYCKASDDTLDRFLGRSDWRDEWTEARAKKIEFDDFLTDSFGRSMESLDYIYPGRGSAKIVRLPGKNVELYRLLVFSRHELGKLFWDTTREIADPQQHFDF